MVLVLEIWNGDGIYDTPFTEFMEDTPSMPMVTAHTFTTPGLQTIIVQVQEVCCRVATATITLNVGQ
jgi:hypothetical protein